MSYYIISALSCLISEMNFWIDAGLFVSKSFDILI